MTLRKFLKLAFEPDHGKQVIELVDARLLSKQIPSLKLDKVNEIAYAAGMDICELVALMLERRCRVCGCTQEDCSQCIEKTGSPCHWVDEDLCSACWKPDKRIFKAE